MQVPLPDGSQLEVTLTEVDDAGAPVLIVWPAFGAKARFYGQLARALAARGIASAVVEWRGQGGSTPRVDRDASFGYHDLASVDAPAVTAAVRAARPHSPLVLLGHSLGGHVSTLYATTHPGEVDGLILVGSASPYFRGYGWTGIPRSYIGTSFMALTSRVVGYWPGDRLKFWGRQSTVLIRDWSRLSRTGRWQPAGADVDYENAMETAQLDVLTISIEGDPLAPVKAVHALTDRLRSARVTSWHSARRVGHIQWVRNHDEILDRIEQWLKVTVA
ncbi:alpha/beta hydrolase family protein [Luteipulveratus halotolerans]|uniref:alpha/beta hydrolase family protein n=1 Tax=Luteipulveratus halotolerans TaxID=1631356 RepID=UPI000681AAAF|nr:alpha/beta fold hydrolase [Luteipulveratus halotolerans]